MSSAVWANRPAWSSVGANAITPPSGKRPKLGLKPAMPQKEAGRSTEPCVWLPMASGTMPAATAAAEPLDDPPGVCAVSSGFRVGPGSK